MDFILCGLQICGNIINQQTLRRFVCYLTWLPDCWSDVFWWEIIWRTRRCIKYPPARIEDGMIWKPYIGASARKIYNAFIIFRFLPLNNTKNSSSWIALLSNYFFKQSPPHYGHLSQPGLSSCVLCCYQSVSLAISHRFTPVATHLHHQFCGCHAPAPPLAADVNRVTTNSPYIIKISVGSLVTKI